LVIEAFKDCQSARETYSFPDGRALRSILGMESEIIPTPAHSDNGVSLILDEEIAFTSDRPELFRQFLI
jgi:hypothetical protein